MSFVIVTFSLGTIVMAGCSDRATSLQRYERDNIVMDTLVHIEVYAPEPHKGKQALDAAFAELVRIGDLSDRFAGKNLADPEVSDVFRINSNAGVKPVKVSDDTLAMLNKSLHYAGLSNGAFDPTVGPLMELWGFGQQYCQVPGSEELKASLALVGFQRLVIDSKAKTVFLPVKGMKVDLGGIAKGYATDRAVEKLREMGIHSAIINAGGNVYALGSRPNGTPWTIGIRDPRDRTRIIAVIKAKDAAVATSGDYERYFIKDGVRYHHILDPSTGKPARHLMAVTVVAANAAQADVLATALFVLGPQSGPVMMRSLSGAKAVFVDKQKNVIITPGLKDKLELVEGGGYRFILEAGEHWGELSG